MDTQELEAAAAATDRRLEMRKQGIVPPPEELLHTQAEIEHGCELAKDRQPTGDPVRIDPESLRQPMSEAEVQAELERQRHHRNTIKVFGENGTSRTYRFDPNGIFRSISSLAPRRSATTSRSRPNGTRARRVAASRDGPSDPSDEPDEHDLSDLRGYAAAELRMVQHVLRREKAVFA